MNAGGQEAVSLHASAVALADRAVLIIGPSGSGKSALALELLAFGCALISDDQVMVCRSDDTLWVRAPEPIRGRIEARFVGLLAAETSPRARVTFIVDMGQEETTRLPPERMTEILGLPIPVVHKIAGSHFPAAILQYLKAGRAA